MLVDKKMDNYEFCTKWILDQDLRQSVRVLDYGCGAGHIVKALRKHKIDSFGCDVFSTGRQSLKSIGAELDNGVIRRMDGDTIPFESSSFDFITNNQVMEHVEDLNKVLSEIHRVLKPGGRVLSLFPDIGVWREGHWGIPFLHWFPKHTRLRIYYAAALRILGFGYLKSTKSVMVWSQHVCEWLDKWTH